MNDDDKAMILAGLIPIVMTVACAVIVMFYFLSE